MAKKYYTLIIKQKIDGAKWTPQFGDYDRAVVVQEMEDSQELWRRCASKIIKTDDGQAAINAAIDKLNLNLGDQK